MSHFTVMVFGEDPEGQLAPYDENLGEECEDPKWDWYSLGGRWSGYFKAKDIKKIFLGTPGVFDNVPANGYGDAMEKGNIDLEGMKSDWINEHGAKYDEITSIIDKWVDDNTKDGVKPEPKPWSYYKGLVENKAITLDEARDLYTKKETYKQPLGAAGYHFFSEDPIEDFWSKTKDDYLDESVKHCMVPYAYVKDGEWFGRGEMGWFGVSLDEMNYDEYLKSFWDTFNSLPDDTMVYLYDCHI